MKHTLTVIASVLVISTACSQPNATGVLANGHPSKANLSAIPATRTYAQQPSGTTHAIADLAFCNFRERRDAKRESNRVTKANDKQIDALKRLRATVNLPPIECSATAFEFANVQVAAAERLFIFAK